MENICTDTARIHQEEHNQTDVSCAPKICQATPLKIVFGANMARPLPKEVLRILIAFACEPSRSLEYEAALEAFLPAVAKFWKLDLFPTY